jgi:hypothetical protein
MAGGKLDDDHKVLIDNFSTYEELEELMKIREANA